jgi:uncharacterized protein
MLKLGEKQTLQMVKKVEFGVYLADPENLNDTRVLLPRKQVPKGLKTGDQIEVFLYRDSDDRLIATVNSPMLTLGKVAVLEVAATSKVGAFLNWGLEKDLFLPYKEQTGRIHKGDQILAALYIDKSERLCATMKVYPYLERTQQYHRDDTVSARVYEVSERFGAYLAVDDKYQAMISPKQDIRSLRPGQVLECRVERVKPDGKLDLTQRDKAYRQIDKDAEKILELLDIYDGELPFNEKSDPQLIMEETGLSKNAFKRALGRLYKEKKITLGERIRKN